MPDDIKANDDLTNNTVGVDRSDISPVVSAGAIEQKYEPIKIDDESLKQIEEELEKVKTGEEEVGLQVDKPENPAPPELNTSLQTEGVNLTNKQEALKQDSVISTPQPQGETPLAFAGKTNTQTLLPNAKLNPPALGGSSELPALTVEDDGKEKPKRSSGLGKVLSVVFGVFLLIGGLGYGYFTFFSQSPEVNEVAGPVVNEDSPEPISIYEITGSEIEINADKLQTEAPFTEVANWDAPARLATITELDTIYRKYRNAIYERDFENFLEVASARMIWIMERRPGFVGYAKDGTPVSRTGDLRGREFFIQNAPMDTFGPLPMDPSLYSATSTEEYDLTADRLEDVILVDTKEKTQTIVKDGEWKYGQVLKYSLTGYEELGIVKPEEGSDGSVVFSYEDGKWRVFAEIWYNLGNVEEYTYGDNDFSGRVRVIEKNAEGEGNNDYPKTINIKAGEGVMWKDVWGIVMSESTEEPWNSISIRGQDYVKVFKYPGIYEYRIAFQEKQFDGKVVVE